MNGVGIKQDELLVAQPSAVAGTARLIARTLLAVLKDQLLVRSLDGYAAYLPAAFDKEAFSFYGTVLSGTPEQGALEARRELHRRRARTMSAVSTSSATSRRRPRLQPTSW